MGLLASPGTSAASAVVGATNYAPAFVGGLNASGVSSMVAGCSGKVATPSPPTWSPSTGQGVTTVDAIVDSCAGFPGGYYGVTAWTEGIVPVNTSSLSLLYAVGHLTVRISTHWIRDEGTCRARAPTSNGSCYLEVDATAGVNFGVINLLTHHIVKQTFWGPGSRAGDLVLQVGGNPTCTTGPTGCPWAGTSERNTTTLTTRLNLTVDHVPVLPTGSYGVFAHFFLELQGIVQAYNGAALRGAFVEETSVIQGGIESISTT